MRFGGSLLLLLLLLPAAACRSFDPQPNVIVVLVDTLRADYLGAYGFHGSISPRFDVLARESIVFRNCFAQSPWTKPSVASLFTSLYPQVHGLTNHEGKYWGEGTPELRTGVLAERATTLAEGLQAAGYQTAGFVTNPWVTAAYGFGQGFDLYDEERIGLLATADDLRGAVRSWYESRDVGRPYFLYLHFMDVHAPYRASEADFKVLRGSRDVFSERKLEPAEQPQRRWSSIELPAEWATDEMRGRVSYWRARYASGVRSFDRKLGELLRWLDEAGELDRSLLVVTSDHGEELFEHGDWSHGQNLFDHQLHVPLVVRNPGGEKGGREVESLVELVDLMPTLLSLAGAAPPAGMQGRDLSEALRGRTIPDPGVTFATATQRRPGLYSARTTGHKLIYDIQTDEAQLFDLAQDAEELQDLSDARVGVTAELRDVLLSHLRDSVAGGTLDVEAATVPAEIRERLRALGYLE